MLIATDGKQAYPVRLKYWWPYRYIGFNSWEHKQVLRAMKTGTRYLSFASVHLDTTEIGVCARCCPKDNPSRAKGRFIVLLRLARILKTMGYKLKNV